MLRFMVGLATLLFGGCISSEPTDYTCPEHETWARIASIEGDTLHVALIDGSPAVLHTEGADFYALIGGQDCFEAYRSGLRQGLEISFHVDQWQDSYPPETDVDFVIQLG